MTEHKWIISYDRAKLKKVDDFYALMHMVDFCRPGHILHAHNSFANSLKEAFTSHNVCLVS